MSLKILPFYKPAIIHNPPRAHLMSIIGDTDSSKAWFYSNFINIYMNKKTKTDFYYRSYMWYSCPLIDECFISRDIIDNKYNFIDFIINSIDNGYYIYIEAANTKYIPAYHSEIDIDHNPMVFGYDTENEIVYLADFFAGEPYNSTKCSFKEIKSAYKLYKDGLHSNQNPNDMYISGIRLLRPRDIAKVTFDQETVITLLYDYLQSRNLFTYSFDRFVYPLSSNNDYAYGLNYYEALKELITESHYCVRHLHLLCDHKQIMKNRIKYMEAIGCLKNADNLFKSCKILESDSIALRNLYIKYRVKTDMNKLEKICNKLLELKELDASFIREFIALINTNWDGSRP